MTVQRLCARHGRYVGSSCPTCRRDRATRPKPKTDAVRIRSTRKWKQVAAAARRRDGNRCTYGLELADFGSSHYPDGRCPVVDGLDGHHRTPIEDGGRPYALDNVRTVCRTHHARLEQVERDNREE